MSKKVGRPEKEFNWEILNSILCYGAKLLDCSDKLGVSEDIIQKRIRDKYDLTFSEYREKKMSFMRLSLLQKQFNEAMNGNTSLLIFLGKQYLGQTDKQEIKQNIEAKVQTIEEYLKDKEAK